MTYKELGDVYAILTKVDTARHGKLSYAILKSMRLMTKHMQDAHAKATEISILTSQVTEQGTIVTNAKGEYQYTQEGVLERNKQLAELNEVKIKLELYKIKDLSLLAEVPYSVQFALDGYMWDLPEEEA